MSTLCAKRHRENKRTEELRNSDEERICVIRHWCRLEGRVVEQYSEFVALRDVLSRAIMSL
jgi:hypothetical protein